MADNGIVGDRIKEFRRLPVSDLIPNPKNWRTHPSNQKSAMAGLIADLGYVDALIAYEGKDGLTLIDGHLRAETTPDAIVPVLILDLDEEEADKMLATFDSVTVLAGADEFLLQDLIANIESNDERVSILLDNIRNGIEPAFEPLGEWDPELGNISDIVPTDDPIKGKITVSFPRSIEDDVISMLDETFKDMPEVEVA